MRAIAIFVILTSVIFAVRPARALEGADGVFDPSSIIKVGSTYHIFVDGTGIVHKTSTDMVNWTTAGTVFGTGDGPNWIQTYVPGFAGYFWAPEIVQIGSKYYLYYACSLGAAQCCIGVATSTDLNTWTDQGVVQYSTSSTTYGSIDPSVFQDAGGNWWLTWGSHLTGIWVGELNSNTGKLLNSTYTNVADFSDAEASKVIRNGSYYYLFYNRGLCCEGLSSTYYVSVARATSPAGPYTGNRVFIQGAGDVIGPGQLGYLDDSGTEYISFHYEDGNSNGYPRLMIDHLTWSGGWPVNNPNWIANGTYKIENKGNGLALTGGTGASLQPVTQNSYTASSDQKWVFTNLGWNVYEITCSTGGLALEAYDCANTNGTALDIYGYWGGTCQQWTVYHASNGSYVFATYNGSGNDTDVIDIPNGSTTAGLQLDLWAYNGDTTQMFTVQSP